MPVGGLVRAMDTKPVSLTGTHSGNINVPHEACMFGQRNAGLLVFPSSPSNRQTSTLVAFSEATAKLTPLPSHVAPSG